MIKIAFIGVPGAGKTTYAGALAYELSRLNRKTKIELNLSIIKEKISIANLDLTKIKNNYLTAYQLYYTEEYYHNLYQNIDYLISDTALFIPYIYGVYLNHFDEDNKKTALYQSTIVNIAATSMYDMVIYLKPINNNTITDKIIPDLNNFNDYLLNITQLLLPRTLYKTAFIEINNDTPIQDIINILSQVKKDFDSIQVNNKMHYH